MLEGHVCLFFRYHYHQAPHGAKTFSTNPRPSWQDPLTKPHALLRQSSTAKATSAPSTARPPTALFATRSGTRFCLLSTAKKPASTPVRYSTMYLMGSPSAAILRRHLAWQMAYRTILFLEWRRPAACSRYANAR